MTDINDTASSISAAVAQHCNSSTTAVFNGLEVKRQFNNIIDRLSAVDTSKITFDINSLRAEFNALIEAVCDCWRYRLSQCRKSTLLNAVIKEKLLAMDGSSFDEQTDSVSFCPIHMSYAPITQQYRQHFAATAVAASTAAEVVPQLNMCQCGIFQVTIHWCSDERYQHSRDALCNISDPMAANEIGEYDMPMDCHDPINELNKLDDAHLMVNKLKSMTGCSHLRFVTDAKTYMSKTQFDTVFKRIDN